MDWTQRRDRQRQKHCHKVPQDFGLRGFGRGSDFLPSLNRSELGKLVFGRIEEMKKLEAIVHPLVREKISAEKARLLKNGESVVFYDVPLLYEKGMEKDFDEVILVYCEPEQQLHRLMQRNSLSKDDAKKRLASQLPLAAKKSRARHVIMNTGDLEFLESEVLRVLTELQLKGKA